MIIDGKIVHPKTLLAHSEKCHTLQKVVPTIATGDMGSPIVEQGGMTENLIREKIRLAIGRPNWGEIIAYTNRTGEFDKLTEAEDSIITEFLALIKEAGYKSPEEIVSIENRIALLQAGGK